MLLVHNIDYKKAAVSCGVSLGVGMTSLLISSVGFEGFKKADKPPFTPPAAAAVAVWAVIYLLMGFSAYLIIKSKCDDREVKYSAVTIYIAQLILSFFNSVIFFNMSAYLLSLIWTVLLLILVIIMYRLFRKISRAAALLQIPYILWLIFAVYLSLGVLLINS